MTSKQILVDGPSANPELVVPRHSASLSHVSLTNLVIEKLPRGAGTAATKSVWEKAEIDSKWSSSSFAKRMGQATRRKELNDFERFKVMRLRKQVCTWLVQYSKINQDFVIDTHVGREYTYIYARCSKR